jgi:hypothetical protein
MHAFTRHAVAAGAMLVAAAASAPAQAAFTFTLTTPPLPMTQGQPGKFTAEITVSPDAGFLSANLDDVTLNIFSGDGQTADLTQPDFLFVSVSLSKFFTYLLPGTYTASATLSGFYTQISATGSEVLPLDAEDVIRIEVVAALVPVPEPAAIAAFGAGLLGLAGLARRRYSVVAATSPRSMA